MSKTKSLTNSSNWPRSFTKEVYHSYARRKPAAAPAGGDGGRRSPEYPAQLRTSFAASSATPKVSVINAQSAPGYALTLRLRHHRYIVTNTSDYARIDNFVMTITSAEAVSVAYEYSI
jgi:hypothetical protein